MTRTTTTQPDFAAEAYSAIRRNMARYSHDLAEDFAQEAIRRALKAKADPNVPYCTQAGKHAAYDYLKREARMHPAGLDGCAPGKLRAGSPDLIRQVMVRQALAQLSDQFRTILTLHYYEGFSTQEIGEQLGLTAGHVQVVLHRGRAKMKRMLLN